MRLMPSLCLTLSLLSLTALPALAQTAPATQPQPSSKSPREAFFRKAFLETYDTSGRRNPKWDDAAHKTIDIIIQYWCSPVDVDPDLPFHLRYHSERAVQAGCDDPLIVHYYLYAHAQVAGRFDLTGHEQFPQQLLDSKYPAYFKIFSLNRLANALIDAPESKADAQRYINTAYDLLPAFATTPEIPMRESLIACIEFTARGALSDGDRKPSIDKIYDILSKANPKSPIADVFKGHAYRKYAWDARGNGYAREVTPEGARLLAERLAVAKAAYKAALAKDPRCAPAAAGMIGALLGADEGPAEMEKYFKLAIAADPDCYDAYANKLYYLTPKWHGTRDDQIKFGRECVASKRWLAEIPFLLLQAHTNVREELDAAPQVLFSIEGRTFDFLDAAHLFKDIPGSWLDIQKLYEGYLAANPNAVLRRLTYATRAIAAGHPEIGELQLKQLQRAAADPVFEKLIKSVRDAGVEQLASVAAADCQQADLDAALAHYNGALVYDPHYAPALGDRGLLRHARGDLKGATTDLAQFIQESRTPDAKLLGQVWLWMVRTQSNLKAQANKDLTDAVAAQKLPRDAWAAKVAAFMLDQMTESDFLKAAEEAKPKGFHNQARFYAAIKRKIAGDNSTAVQYFKAAINESRKDLPEINASFAHLAASGNGKLAGAKTATPATSPLPPAKGGTPIVPPGPMPPGAPPSLRALLTALNGYRFPAASIPPAPTDNAEYDDIIKQLFAKAQEQGLTFDGSMTKQNVVIVGRMGAKSPMVAALYLELKGKQLRLERTISASQADLMAAMEMTQKFLRGN